jgi:hypothetical protein
MRSPMNEPQTKRCGRCGEVKKTSEFHRRRGGFQSWCKACKSEAAAEHYRANRDSRSAHNKLRQGEFRAWYTGLKAGKPCTDCGRIFHPAAMHWDHLPGYDKSAPLGELVRHGSREQVLREIAKCELVCANCHAVRTVRRHHDA